MIRNIVFDFGNVLVHFDPVSYIRPFVHTPVEAAALSDLIFLSKPWKDGDRGLMDRPHIIDAICADHPEQAALIRRIMEPCDEMLTMPEDTPAFLRQLHQEGYRLFCITNTNESAYAYMRKAHPVLSELDGGIASFQEGLLKPDPRIFQLLLQRYSLKAEECLFVDDMPENTAAAIRCGYQALTLPGADQLRPCLTARLNAEA